ncbi:ribonuclease H-like domain-containing protein, partial [Phellopilus nigrolimitatus]
DLPPYSYTERFPCVRLLYIHGHEETNRELDGLFAAPPHVVSFDLEWRPSFTPGSPKHPVALVQIATPEMILLLQISALKSHKLIDFLDDESIVKAGVNILADCQNLYRDFTVFTRSYVEPSYLARYVDGTRWPGAFIGLARLVSAYESRSLSKGKTQFSNWEANLTAIQQHYAANDAHSGLVLYTGLFERARDIESSYHTFNVINGDAFCPYGSPWQHMNLNPGPAAAPASAEGVVEAAAQTETQRRRHRLRTPMILLPRTGSRTLLSPASKLC